MQTDFDITTRVWHRSFKEKKKPERRERTAGISRNRTTTVLQRSGKVKNRLGRAEEEHGRSQGTCTELHKATAEPGWDLLQNVPCSVPTVPPSPSCGFRTSLCIICNRRQEKPPSTRRRKSRGPNLALQAAARAPRLPHPAPDTARASDAQRGSRPEQRGLTRAGGK